jgi:DNA-directed RNA polymerase specialized sigma24 family protein
MDIEAFILDRLFACLQAALPDEQREVVLLRAVERMPNDEVARILGKTPAATSKLFNRTLARLGTAVGSLRGWGG